MSRRAAGLRAWVAQRLTAVYLALFLLFLLVKFALDPPLHHAEWRGWLADPVVGISCLLFFLALQLHAWVGVRDILMDYARPIALRAVLMSLVLLTLLACGVWAVQLLILARVG